MNGHVTKYSDASSYDEICVNCGAHDGWGRLAAEPCPKPPGEGGLTYEEWRQADRIRIEKLRLRRGGLS